MPRRLTEFRSSSQNLKVEDNTITLNLSDYGTIQTSETSLAAATANGDLLRRVYTDALKYRMTASNTQIVDIVCPSGNYYFSTGYSSGGNLFPLDLSHSYGMRVRIRAASIPSWGNKPVMGTNAGEFLYSSLTVQDRYTQLKNFFGTRFYFSGNGINGGSSAPNFGRNNIWGIGIFGRQSESSDIGSFNTSSTVFCRGVSGNITLDSCCVFGFGNFTWSTGSENAVQGWGIGSDGGEIRALNIIISDCGRGIHVQRNGSFVHFGSLDCVKNNEFGVLTSDNGVAYLGGEGSSLISHNGVNGINCQTAGLVRFGNGSHVLNNNPTNIYISTGGIVTYQSGQLSPASATQVSGGSLYSI